MGDSKKELIECYNTIKEKISKTNLPFIIYYLEIIIHFETLQNPFPFEAAKYNLKITFILSSY